MNTLKAEKRSMSDKAKKLRREGYVTGNMFGRSLAESIPVQIEKKEAEKIKKDQKQDQQVQMGILQYLLGLQYSYQKNRRQMELYLNKARVNLKGTPYHKKVKQLLNKA